MFFIYTSKSTIWRIFCWQYTFNNKKVTHWELSAKCSKAWSGKYLSVRFYNFLSGEYYTCTACNKRWARAFFFMSAIATPATWRENFCKCISATFSRNCTFNISATGFLSADCCNLLKKCCSETAYPHFYNWFWKCGLKKLQNFASAVTRSKHACLRM